MIFKRRTFIKPKRIKERIKGNKKIPSVFNKNKRR
jgi:hypothetical protein